MAKPSPWEAAFPRPTLARETETLTDAATGYALTLTLEEMDEPALGVATDLLEEYQLRYLTPGRDGKPRGLLLPGGRGRARLSGHLLRQCAMLATMERPPEGETAFGVLDWYGVAAQHPDAWRQVIAFANRVGAPAGNAAGETEADTTAASATPAP